MVQRSPVRDDDFHGPLLDDFSRDTGAPRDRASAHSPEYEDWLSRRAEIRQAFDDHALQPEHLEDQWVRDRLDGMTLRELYDYRLEYIGSGANDPTVVTHLTNLMTNRPLEACSASDVTTTETKARAAMADFSTEVDDARTALDRLHGAWIDHKTGLLAGTKTLSGEVACAFRSNFNVTERDATFGTNHIRVASRLKQLASRLRRAVDFVCEGLNNPICIAGTGADAEGFVVNGSSPIHLCAGFRDSVDTLHQKTVVLHEFLHLLAGVDDAGGYATLGAQATTCSANAKFRGSTADLIGSADSLAGFILHILQTSSTDVTVT